MERKYLRSVDSRVRVTPYKVDVLSKVIGLFVGQDGQKIPPRKKFAGRVADDAFRVLFGA